MWEEAAGPQESAAKPLTAEQKLRAMLGYQELEGGQRNPVFWREDFCGVCGTQHLNPSVLDTYAFCERCQSPLRPPGHLRKRFERLEPRQYLEILFASYGDEVTEKGAVDVTSHIKGIMAAKETEEYLAMGPAVNLRKLFGFDPAPEKRKQIRIRCVFQHIRCTHTSAVVA
jgi:hypothetical protein